MSERPQPERLRETMSLPRSLEMADFHVELPDDLVREIQELREVEESEYIETVRPILRAIMANIRRVEGEKIRGDKWVYHMLPDPNDPERNNPLVVLPGHGCGYEKASGGCSMCNFAGEGRDATKQDVDEAMDFLISNQEDHFVHKINLNALGSFFHDKELTPDLRSYIYQRIREYAEKVGDKGLVLFVTEGRLDHITDKKMKEMRDGIGEHVLLDVGVGVESTDPLVRETIINKGLPENWEKRLQIIKEYQPVNVETHIIFGTPFLDESQTIRDTVKSVKDMIEISESEGDSRDLVLFMVMNRKPGTLTEYLARGDQYQLPNLMATAEALLKIGELVSLDSLKHVMVFGLVGPDVHAEAGTQYVGEDTESAELKAIHEILLNWRGLPEDLDKLRSAFDAVPKEIRTAVGYHGPYEGVGLTKEEKKDLRTTVAEAYYRLVTTFFPHLEGLSFEEISQYFKKVKV
ncbi:MAG: hypothetical protein ABH826_01485 [Patescibacteria group bacterium]